MGPEGALALARQILPLAAVLMWLAIAAPALAAPTCLDDGGQTVRCGTSTARPVGSVLPPEQVLARAAQAPEDLSPRAIFGLICTVGGLFALILLLPDFDGWRAGDLHGRDDDAD